MEQMHHRREGIQNDLDKAYDEGHRDNEVFDEVRGHTEGETHIPDAGLQSQLSKEGKAMVDIEEVKDRFSTFITKIHTTWHGKETAERYKYKPSVIASEDVDWDAHRNNIDETKYGEYTLNLDTVGIDPEGIPPEKIESYSFVDKLFVGKPRADLAKFVIKNYANRYYLPGIEYWEYIDENPDKAPSSLKKVGYKYHFFGSMLRNGDGAAFVPFVQWTKDGHFTSGAHALGSGWDEKDLFVLLKK